MKLLFLYVNAWEALGATFLSGSAMSVTGLDIPNTDKTDYLEASPLICGVCREGNFSQDPTFHSAVAFIYSDSDLMETLSLKQASTMERTQPNTLLFVTLIHRPLILTIPAHPINSHMEASHG